MTKAAEVTPGVPRMWRWLFTVMVRAKRCRQRGRRFAPEPDACERVGDGLVAAHIIARPQC